MYLEGFLSSDDRFIVIACGRAQIVVRNRPIGLAQIIRHWFFDVRLIPCVCGNRPATVRLDEEVTGNIVIHIGSVLEQLRHRKYDGNVAEAQDLHAFRVFHE